LVVAGSRPRLVIDGRGAGAGSLAGKLNGDACTADRAAGGRRLAVLTSTARTKTEDGGDRGRSQEPRMSCCWAAPGSGAGAVRQLMAGVWMCRCSAGQVPLVNTTPAFGQLSGAPPPFNPATHSLHGATHGEKKYASSSSSARLPCPSCLAPLSLSACVCVSPPSISLPGVFRLTRRRPIGARLHSHRGHLDSLQTASFAPATKSRPRAARHSPTPALRPHLSCCSPLTSHGRLAVHRRRGFRCPRRRSRQDELLRAAGC
jgi:hypothetical protein